MNSTAFWTRREVDHSRRGEYSVAHHYFYVEPPRRFAPESAWVVDVGAYARKTSNSYDLIAQHGWRGLLVEADPKQAKTCVEEFPEDTIVECVAVSDYEGRAPFYRNLQIPSWSSLDPKWKPKSCKERIQVPVTKLETLLRRHDVPHDFNVLSVDVENRDGRVVVPLLTETPWRPELLILEHEAEAPVPYASTLTDAGYVVYYMTEDNWIWRFDSQRA